MLQKRPQPACQYYLSTACTILYMLCLSVLTFGKDIDSAKVKTSDTIVSTLVKKVTDAGNHDREQSEQSFQEGKMSIRQSQVLNSLIQTAQETKIYLDAGMSLPLMQQKLSSIRKSFELAKDGILINTGTAQTDRNLTVSSVILDQLITETQESKTQVDKYLNDLVLFRSNLDSLLSDPAIYAFPHDSAKLVHYLARLKVIVSQGNPTDNALNDALVKVAEVQNEVDNTLFELRVANEQIERYRNKLSNMYLKREFHDIWDRVAYSRSFKEIVQFSIAKERIALAFYASDNIARLLLLLLLTGLLWFAIRSLKKHVAEHTRTKELVHQLVLRHPFASACLIVFSIFQFAFINAPFIFSFCIWSVQIGALLVTLYRFITLFWFKFWIIASMLFLLACIDNFILQASRPERWVMMVLASAGICFSVYYLLSRTEISKLKERSILIFIRYLLIFESLSLLLNTFGRYNLSKTFMTAGYTGMVTAIMFIWVVRLINELLSTASELYQHPERKLFYLNFNRVGSKSPFVFYVLLVIGWFIIVGRNFYFFKKVSVPFHDFLHKPRSIGDYTFQIEGLFLFLIIAACAMLLSKLVSLFSADPNAEHGSVNGKQQRASLGSWILLVRIVIISLGMFVAFAASGLPIDKITIVLGALSVGIGLGLQSLVSNLVSGLIIAFERPVNVGDQIEINGKAGVMKSIGFRSSIVTLNDGSCLIVPNGDLLSTHLINWSISKNTRKVIVPVDIAFGSSIEAALTLLKQIALDDERILKTPAALTIARHFGDSAIQLELIFWIKSPNDTAAVSSSVIVNIDKLFREQGVKIAYPERNIHIIQSKEDDKEGA